MASTVQKDLIKAQLLLLFVPPGTPPMDPASAQKLDDFCDGLAKLLYEIASGVTNP